MRSSNGLTPRPSAQAARSARFMLKGLPSACRLSPTVMMGVTESGNTPYSVAIRRKETPSLI